MQVFISMLTPIITGVAVSLIVFFVTRYYGSVQAKKATDMERKETERLETARVNGEKIDDLTALTMAMAQHKIIAIGTSYIRKGSVTTEEKAILEDIYIPYHNRGGNSNGKTIMEEVEKLPVETSYIHH